MQHAWKRRDVHTIFLSENLKGRDHMEDLGVCEKITLEWILGIQNGKFCTGFIWLTIGSSGGLLWTQLWTTHQELCSVTLVKTHEPSCKPVSFEKPKSCVNFLSIIWCTVHVQTQVTGGVETPQHHVPYMHMNWRHYLSFLTSEYHNSKRNTYDETYFMSTAASQSTGIIFWGEGEVVFNIPKSSSL